MLIKQEKKCERDKDRIRYIEVRESHREIKKEIGK